MAVGRNGAILLARPSHANRFLPLVRMGEVTSPHGKNMPKFVSTHVIACMTRQDVARLLKRFKEEENTDVRNIRVLCDTLSGRMVCEWEASNRVALIEWLKKCNVQIRGTGEWIMAVQYESVDDELVVPR